MGNDNLAILDTLDDVISDNIQKIRIILYNYTTYDIYDKVREIIKAFNAMKRHLVLTDNFNYIKTVYGYIKQTQGINVYSTFNVELTQIELFLIFIQTNYYDQKSQCSFFFLEKNE
jgi:hypothetical protein